MGAHAVRPLDRMIWPDLHGRTRLTGLIQRNPIQIVRYHVVDVEFAAQKRNAVNAVERAILDQQFGLRGAWLEAENPAAESIADIEGLIRPDDEIISKRPFAGPEQVLAYLSRYKPDSEILCSLL
jgi:hypothetical protein